MEWVALVALVAGGGGFVAKRWRDRKALHSQDREELDGVRRLADEDVTILGEQLQRLDREVAGRELDEPTRVAYQVALDSYEAAQRAAPRLRRAGPTRSARSPTLSRPGVTRWPAYRLESPERRYRSCACPASSTRSTVLPCET